MNVHTTPTILSTNRKFWLPSLVLGLVFGVIAFFYSNLVGILVLLSIVILTAILAFPELGFYLCIATLPIASIRYLWLDNTESVPISILLLHVLLVPTLISWMLSRAAHLRPAYQKTGMEWPMFWLVVWTWLSLYWTVPNSFSNWQAFLILFSFIFVILTIATIHTAKQLERTIYIWLSIALVGCVLAFISKFTGFRDTIYQITDTFKLHFTLYTGVSEPPSGGYFQTRRAGGFDIHDNISAFINLSLFLGLGMLFTCKKTYQKVLLSLMVFSNMIIVYLTYSRGALFGMLVGLFVFLAFHPVYRKNLLRYSVTTFALMLCLFLFIYRNNMEMAILRITVIFKNFGASGTTARITIWKDGLRHLWEHFFLGHGIGGFRMTFGHPHAHNIYFSVLFDVGFIGFTLLVWIIGIMIKNLRQGLSKLTASKYRILLSGYIGGLCAFGFHALVDFDYTWIHCIWVYLALGFCIVRVGLSEEPLNQ